MTWWTTRPRHCLTLPSDHPGNAMVQETWPKDWLLQKYYDLRLQVLPQKLPPLWQDGTPIPQRQTWRPRASDPLSASGLQNGITKLRFRTRYPDTRTKDPETERKTTPKGILNWCECFHLCMQLARNQATLHYNGGNEGNSHGHPRNR